MGKWFFDYFINIKNGYYNLENSCNIIIDKILLYDIKDINYISIQQKSIKKRLLLFQQIFQNQLKCRIL